MGIATSYSAQLVGLSTEIVTIEVDISNGLNAFSIVGLGDRSVIEARDRIAAAIKNTGYTSPKQKNQKTVISLAPADIRKEGPAFDLAMALAYLKAAKEIDYDHEGKLFLGELSLEGNIRKIHGLLPIICQATQQGFSEVFIPIDNIREASLARGITIYGVSSLKEIIEHLTATNCLTPIQPYAESPKNIGHRWPDIQTIRGNETAKRGLEIAAAGAHNILMFGPPGTGKTMLAQSLPSIMPRLSYEQSVEVTGIHSAARTLTEDLIVYPPFRSPHHTASYVSIVGGGSIPRPGEITLAHRGILFLDELPEFDRDVLEALRQPLEEKTITISRARGSSTFPAQCILVASMNPCPCGKGKDNGCTCLPKAFESYRRRISGPIMDRMDIWINVNKIDYEKLSSRSGDGESSQTTRDRVAMSRDRQIKRFVSFGIPKHFNSEMSARDIEMLSPLDNELKRVLLHSAEKLRLSARAFHRVIKVAQTIADLAGSASIRTEHLMEALQYRQKMNV